MPSTKVKLGGKTALREKQWFRYGLWFRCADVPSQAHDSVVNNPPAMKETKDSSLGQEGPLEKEMATHSSGESHGQRSLGGYSPRCLKEVQHNLATKQNKKICCYSGREYQITLLLQSLTPSNPRDSLSKDFCQACTYYEWESDTKRAKKDLSWQATGYDFAFQCRVCRFNPWSGSWDPTCSQPKYQNIEKKQYCNKLKKDLFF